MKLAPLSTLSRPVSQPQQPEPSPFRVPATAASPAEDTFDFQTVTWQADGFGFDATSGEFFTASPTALVVMQALSNGMTRLQILDRLTSRFEVSRSTAERDLESFLAELVRLGLASESN